MSDVTPPKPPTPKAAAKGLSGLFKKQPKWVLIAGFTVLVGVAFMAWKRSQAGDPTADTMDGTSDEVLYEQPDGPMMAGDYGGGYITAPATQGAFGGYDSPSDFYPDAPADNAGGPESVVVNVSPGVVYQDPPDVPRLTSPIPTGGGRAPSRGVGNHRAVAKNAKKPAQKHPAPKKGGGGAKPKAPAKKVVGRVLPKVVARLPAKKAHPAPKAAPKKRKK